MKKSPLFDFAALPAQGARPLKELFTGLARKKGADFALAALLNGFAWSFRLRPGLRSWLITQDGPFEFTLGIATEDGRVARALRFEKGRVRVLKKVPPDAETMVRLVDEKALVELLTLPPHDALNLSLQNRMVVTGNPMNLMVFQFLISLVQEKRQKKALAKERQRDRASRMETYGGGKYSPVERKSPALPTAVQDPGVCLLDDPGLGRYRLSDFPRIQAMLEDHFSVVPEVCAERPLLLTRFYRKHGFERDAKGRPWDPALRQGYAFQHLMSKKKPIIAKGSQIAGTTTAKDPVGVVIYPDAQGLLFWPELLTASHRPQNPCHVSEETVRVLHREVFPFWTARNFGEWVRNRYRDPDCQKINNRWVAYFVWKAVGLSHVAPDFETVLSKGTLALVKEAGKKRREGNLEEKEKNELRAMQLALAGINQYAKNLRHEALEKSRSESSPTRKRELLELSRILARVPRRPAGTLHEAMNSAWIVFLALHNENTNTGFSFGRMDRLFQPYFERDAKALPKGKKAREAYIRRALELTADFMMRGSDHLPLVPDLGNRLFGGSSSNQAITLGGVNPDGTDAVCDMTYLFLKATEMLAIRDPNVNARFHPGVNSETYLKRLCAVNYKTTATPSMHNDEAVFKALARFGYPEEHLRDWIATGCVEPSLPGRHLAHTGSILFNLVAAVEMALHNGRHPLMRLDLGPRTGSPEAGDFPDFESFFAAFASQLKLLADRAAEYNHQLARSHEELRPTPLLSILMDGCLETGKDVTSGGARYNSSGTANIGLADVTDSLLAIKSAVYETGRVSFGELVHALDRNFEGAEALRAWLLNKAPKFGSGDPAALAMAKRVAELVHGIWAGKKNYRGGAYTTGFWSMSQHVAYGNLSGALPSGRLAGKAFTPGLTPSPGASESFLDNIRDVGSLEPEHMENSIAFNVKLVPKSGEPAESAVDAMAAYVKAYFSLGGMQMQFNVVDSQTLKDAMAHPDGYRNLLVRISGYNAYFVTLNRPMQEELIERAQYGV